MFIQEIAKDLLIQVAQSTSERDARRRLYKLGLNSSEVNELITPDLVEGMRMTWTQNSLEEEQDHER